MDLIHDGRWILRFTDAESCRGFFEPALEQRAFLVEMKIAPTLLEPFTVRVEVRGGVPFEIDPRPVQAFPGDAAVNVAFELSGAVAEEVRRRLARLAESGQREESETRGTSPLLRIQEMNPNERARLALNCGRTERQILRRDRSPQVLLNLVNNPRTEAEDVLAVVKSPQVNAGTLERVASDRRWMGNMEIRNAVVRNPKTPSPTAIRNLDHLRTEDLRKLAKIGACRENVRRAALKIYLKRQKK